MNFELKILFKLSKNELFFNNGELFSVNFAVKIVQKRFWIFLQKGANADYVEL